jgi:hypothetical protein
MGWQPDIEANLSAYLDGELSPAEAQRVEEAVGRDPALAGELAALRRTRGLVRGLPRAAGPAHLTDRILSQTRGRGAALAGRHAAGASVWGRVLHYAATAAAAVIAMGVGALVVVTLARGPRPPETARGGGSGPTGVEHRGRGGACPAGGYVIDAVFAQAPRNEVIHVDDLDAARRQVLRAFARNGLQPVKTDPDGRALAQRAIREALDRTCNLYQLHLDAPQQVQYEVVATAEQVASLEADLKAIRGRQSVSQEPLTILADITNWSVRRRGRTDAGGRDLGKGGGGLKSAAGGGPAAADQYGKGGQEAARAKEGERGSGAGGAAGVLQRKEPKAADDAEAAAKVAAAPARPEAESAPATTRRQPVVAEAAGLLAPAAELRAPSPGEQATSRPSPGPPRPADGDVAPKEAPRPAEPDEAEGPTTSQAEQAEQTVAGIPQRREGVEEDADEYKADAPTTGRLTVGDHAARSSVAEAPQAGRPVGEQAPQTVRGGDLKDLKKRLRTSRPAELSRHYQRSCGSVPPPTQPAARARPALRRLLITLDNRRARAHTAYLRLGAPGQRAPASRPEAGQGRHPEARE